jgi:hypothetical protein
VSLVRWLGVLCCAGLMAMPAFAQVTISQNFSAYPNAGTGTAFTEVNGSGQAGTGMNDGPPGPACTGFYYRLTYTGVGSTNNMLVFDLPTPTGPVTSVVGDFDFRAGGTFGAHADGMGWALLPTSIYGQTGNGLNGATKLPSITEEGSQAKDGSLGFGLDTYNNGTGGGDIGDSNLPNGSDASEVSVNPAISPSVPSYILALTVYAVDMYGLPIGPGNSTNAYDLHNDNATDCTVFDHCHFTVNIDPNGGGAAVVITITSNQPPATSTAADANPYTTLAPGTSFTAASTTVGGILPYEMRLGFGGRTGGANDNNDIANVNVTFTP